MRHILVSRRLALTLGYAIGLTLAACSGGHNAPTAPDPGTPIPDPAPVPDPVPAPDPQPEPQGVKPLVELLRRKNWRHAEVFEGKPAAIGLDVVVVNRIVKRKILERLTRSGIRDVRLEHHLVGDAVDVE